MGAGKVECAALIPPYPNVGELQPAFFVFAGLSK